MPYECSGQRVVLVVDPHQQKIVSVENEQGEKRGEATPLDKLANSQRRRCRSPEPENRDTIPARPRQLNAVEQAYQSQQSKLIKKAGSGRYH